MRSGLLSAIFALFTALSSAAQVSYTPATVPNVQLQDRAQFVSNPDGILSRGTVDEINRMCLELKDRDLAQVVVLMLGSVDEDHLDMFAHNVLNLWGVGSGEKDNGLVISVVKQQRDIQFETGYGLEGVLPDAICKRIQTQVMIPYLKNDDWNNGVLKGVEAVYDILNGNAGELGAAAARGSEKGGGDIFWIIALLMLPVFAIIWVFGLRRRARTCPRCKTRGGLKPVGSKVVSRTKTTETREDTYRCKNCGNVVKRRSTHNRGGGGGAIIGGGAGGFGGGFGGGRGGGFGGGFGGGMSGGGGARSGF